MEIPLKQPTEPCDDDATRTSEATIVSTAPSAAACINRREDFDQFWCVLAARGRLATAPRAAHARSPRREADRHVP